MPGEENEEGGRFPLAFPDLSPVKSGLAKTGSVAKSMGVNIIAQNVIKGYFTKKLEQLRSDQLQTLLESGVFLADLVSEDDVPESIETPLNLLSNFMSREKMIAVLDSLVTPQLVAEMLKKSSPETYSQILSHPGGGKRWFISQTQYLKIKLKRIIARV